VIDSATPRADGKYLAQLHGGTHATGSFAGDSTYRMTLVYDPTTGMSVGSTTETWTATVAGRGSGHVIFAEHAHQDGDGSVRVTGVVTGGDGVFAGATGFGVWTGAFAASGSDSGPGQGTSTMALGLRDGAAAATAGSAATTDPVPYRIVELHGSWVDPGQPEIVSVTPRADGKTSVGMHGLTHSTGAFVGDSTYDAQVVFDATTGDAIGSSTETYDATVARGSGHVTFAEHVHQDGGGPGRVTGVVTGGDGVFTGATGLAVWTGEQDPATNVITGSYTMLVGLTR
jgi:hypothetical protein